MQTRVIEKRSLQTGFGRRDASLRASLGILLFALAGWLGGCTSSPEASPGAPPQDSGLDRHVKNVAKRHVEFGGRAKALLQDIAAFRGQSGWNELAPILKSTRMAPTEKSSEGAAKSLTDRLQAWGQKWNQSPATVSHQYQQLVERSSAAEKERAALVDAWADVQTQVRERIRSSGDFSTKNTDAITANASLTYEMNRTYLKRVGLDELGLLVQMTE